MQLVNVLSSNLFGILFGKRTVVLLNGPRSATVRASHTLTPQYSFQRSTEVK
jgi:hypothetical protein